jgi:hypothetical protein
MRLSLDTKEKKMKLSQLLTNVSFGLAVAGALAVMSPVASQAFDGHKYYYQPDDDGALWSYYPGYFSSGPADQATNEDTRTRGQSSAQNSNHRKTATQARPQQHQPNCTSDSEQGCR